MNGPQKTCSIAVLASGNGTNLQKLIDIVDAGRLPCKISLVASNKENSQALERARKHHLPHCFLSHRDFDRREDFDRKLLEIILQSDPQLVVLAGFMRVLTGEFVAPLRGRLINLHPSLLPKYPGLQPHQKALEAGDREHGATVHFVTEELDLGPRIVQGRIAIQSGEDAATLKQRVQREVEYSILPLAVKWFAQGRLKLNNHGVLLDGETLPQSGYQWNGSHSESTYPE